MPRKRTVKDAQGKPRVEVFFKHTAVEVGLRHTGKPQGLADTVNGVYWMAMAPPDDADARKIQRAFAPGLNAKVLTP